MHVSTNDAVQGVLFALCSDLRGRPLVPPPGQFVTTNSGGLRRASGVGGQGRLQSSSVIRMCCAVPSSSTGWICLPLQTCCTACR